MSSSSKIISKSSNKVFQRKLIEQEKALRDQLHIEIENKTKACSNPTYNCSIPRLDGYEFCIRHILQDPRAPFKQCAYIYPTNNKKCIQAAPKHDIKKEPGATALTNYCFEHSRLVQLNKTHEIIGQYKHVETNEAFLNDLTHHIKVEKQESPQRPSSTVVNDTDEEIDVVSSNIEPFINYVHVTEFNSKHGKKEKRRVLDYASDNSTDDDVPTISNTWKDKEWDNSDAESVDSQNEDFLKHAGIYTTEEATMIAKQKMIRLQNLYTGQIQRLQHLLKEKRRKYLQAIRKERETLCSIHDQPKDTPEERRLYEKLKALNHYHKRHGMEAILQKKYHEKRLKAANEGIGQIHKGPLYTKCIFTEGGVKCGERALPCCKYCRKHILEDKKQILFRSCGIEKSGIVCQEPVPNIFEDATCVLHINFPTQKNYTQKKFESETEEEDEDNHGHKKHTIKMETTTTTTRMNIDDNNDGLINHNNVHNKNVEFKFEETESLFEITIPPRTTTTKLENNDKSNNLIININNNNNNDGDENNQIHKNKNDIKNNNLNMENDVEMCEITEIGNNVTISHDLGKNIEIISSSDVNDEKKLSTTTTTTATATDRKNEENEKQKSSKKNNIESNNEEILFEIVTGNE